MEPLGQQTTSPAFWRVKMHKKNPGDQTRASKKVGAGRLEPRTSLSGAAAFTGQQVIHILTAIAKLRGLVPEFALSPFMKIS